MHAYTVRENKNRDKKKEQVCCSCALEMRVNGRASRKSRAPHSTAAQQHSEDPAYQLAPQELLGLNGARGLSTNRR